MNLRHLCWILPLGALACRKEAPSKAKELPPPTLASVATGANTSNAWEQLAAQDARKPVPLLPMMANHQKQNMREHLVAVQGVVQGLAKQDFHAVEEAAKQMGYSETMGAMCSHMGAGAPGFTEDALAFHRSADKVAEVARTHDAVAVARALDATLQTCTSCHATWRQQVVDQATWEKVSKGMSLGHGPASAATSTATSSAGH